MKLKHTRMIFYLIIILKMLNISTIKNILNNENSPKIIYLLFSSLLLTFRFCLSFDSFNWLHILLLMVIFIQLMVLIFWNSLKQIFKKYEVLLHIFSLIIHTLAIYFNSNYKWQFFQGMELLTMIYLNFKKTSSFRLFCLGFSIFLFATKDNNYDIDIAECLYSLSFLFFFEYSLRDDNMSFFSFGKSKHKHLNSKMKSFQKKDNNYNPIAHSNSTGGLDKDLINSMEIGLLIINQNYEAVYSNGITSKISKLKDIEESKRYILSLRENIDLKKSDIWKISDSNLKKRFKASLDLQELYKNQEDDDIHEGTDYKIPFSSESFINSYLNKEFEEEIPFKQWRKKRLAENLKVIPTNYDFSEDKQCSYSVREYLEKLFDYYKEETGSYFRSSSYNKGAVKKFSMYAECNKNDEKYSKLFISFVLLENRMSNLTSGVEILLIIRELSEIEKKYYDEGEFKNQILSSFCLELRTPINGLINMLDLMNNHMKDSNFEQDDDFDENFNELLDNAVISSHLLLNQINDFLDYFSYRNEILEAHPGPFDFKGTLQEIHKIFGNIAARKNIKFIVQMDENIPSIVYNDYRRILQIIFNLLNNSLKFTTSGCFIKILAVLKKGQYIQISVIDNGIGIKSDDLASLGKLYHEEQNELKSTCGLGLFICNFLSLIIEENETTVAHKKKGLTVYSEPGLGTCFTFRVKCDFDSKFNYHKENIASNESSFENKFINLSSFRSVNNTSKKFIHRSSKEKSIYSKSMKRDETYEIRHIKSCSPERKSSKIRTSHNFGEISNRSIFNKKFDLDKNNFYTKFFKKKTLQEIRIEQKNLKGEIDREKKKEEDTDGIII